MKKVNYKIGDKVTYQGKEHEIVATQKDFSTKKIFLVLAGAPGKPGFKVEATELTMVKAGKVADPELEALRAEYSALWGKAPAASKKNNKAWLAKKIAEKKPKLDPVKSDYEILAELSREELVALIGEKELEIEAEDYDDDNELLQAVCEELEVEIPEKEEE